MCIHPRPKPYCLSSSGSVLLSGSLLVQAPGHFNAFAFGGGGLLKRTMIQKGVHFAYEDVLYMRKEGSASKHSRNARARSDDERDASCRAWRLEP